MEDEGAKNADMASPSFPFSRPIALELDLEAALGVTALLLRASPSAGRARLSMIRELISHQPDYA